MKNRILALALVVALVVGIVPAYAAGATFSDVSPTHWAYQDVEAAVADGVLNGVGGGRFNPGGKLTIAEWSCILARGFYAQELANSSVGYITWFNREAAVLQGHGVYSGIGTNNDISFHESASRNQMAVTIANLLKDRGVSVSAADIATAKAAITDMDTIPAEYRDAVATCWALGIINGVGGGRFDGGGTMQRDAAAAVYNRTKKALQNGGQAVAPDPMPSTEPEPTPSTPVTPPVTGSVVGTISTEKVTINKDSVKTHAPVVDYWSSQPAEIQAIADKDYFNAACQTIKDAELMTTQGELLPTGVNPYYNYAVVATSESQGAKNVTLAMGNLSAKGCTFLAGGNTGYVYRYARPLRETTVSAPRFAAAIASLTPGMTDREKAEICVKAVCDQIDYDVDGTASWDNGGDKGFCETYMRMLSQILSAANIPNICVTGTVTGGSHAWNMVYLKDPNSNTGAGSWYIMDGTCFEAGYDAVLTYAQHESIFNYSHSLNDRDFIKVARALVELFF